MVRLKFALSPFPSQSLWKGCSTVILNFFQIIVVYLFLAHHDHYFVKFKDSNVFEFTGFPFKAEYNNTAVCSANSHYLFSKRKQEKKIVETTV